ncbi:MAG: Sedlin [Monoraphidium minutum]|nr:MAG: Sedlin [Monoraphidium minutum]
MIVCAAVVGPQNNPLFLATYVPTDDEAKFHCIVHCSLDAVEEKVLLRRAPGEVPELYLGLLYPTEEYRVFGYITNSHTKFILVLDEFSPREDLLAKAFKAVHHAYVDAASNPFYTAGLPLTSPAFAEEVAAVARGYAQQLAAA